MEPATSARIKTFFSQRGSLLAWCLIACVSLWHLFFIRIADNEWKNVIASDGAGYYAYLPASFIYHDYKYNFCLRGHSSNPGYYGNNVALFIAKNSEGKLANKYFIGTTVLMTPFFFIAHGIALAGGMKADGYGFIYQFFLCLAGLLYLLAGLWCLRKLLLRFGLREGPVALTLLTLFFGTNLYHYALEEPTMSHVYSFAATCFFLLHASEFLRSKRKRNFFAAAISFVLIVAIRPTNAVVLLAIPFLQALIDPGKPIPFSSVKKNWLIVPLLIALLLLFLQALMYRLTTGEWALDSYPGETFDFLHPHLFEVLFSWRKGLFIYTPILFLSVAGFFFLPGKRAVLLLCVFQLVNLWIISSWHDWPYGGSLGMRPFIDSYGILAIPMAFLFEQLRKNFALVLTGLAAFLLAFLNLVQHYQYHTGILPYDNMTWRKYKLIFLQTEKFYDGLLYFEPGRLPDNVSFLKEYHLYFENDSLPASDYGVSTKGKNVTPPNAVFMHDTIRNTPDISVYYKGTIPDSLLSKTWVSAKIKLWFTSPAGHPKMLFVFSENGVPYAREERAISLETGSWQEFQSAMKLPVAPGGNGRVSVYMKKDDDSPAYADNFEVSFWVEEAE